MNCRKVEDDSENLKDSDGIEKTREKGSWDSFRACAFSVWISISKKTNARFSPDRDVALQLGCARQRSRSELDRNGCFLVVSYYGHVYSLTWQSIFFEVG